MKDMERGWLWWLIFSLIAFAFGIDAIISGTVMIFDKRSGEVASVGFDAGKYWYYTSLYFLASLFFIHNSLRKIYPKWIQKVMDFNEFSSLSMLQLAYIFGVILYLFGGAYLISSGLASN